MVLLLSACGKTELVDGRNESFLPVEISDAGEVIHAGSCTGNLCPRGFHCERGVCLLNGNDGQLQVTLQWKNDPRTPEDLDLHVIEPSVRGPCEIYFATSGRVACVGKLDLDANRSCIDSDPSGGLGADTENIIYPFGLDVPRGHYLVRVSYWDECTTFGVDTPYVVTVRNGGTILRRRGAFHPGQSNFGTASSGVTVLEFDVQ